MLCSQWLVTGMTCNDVRGAARRHALNGSQIKRRVNQLSMMLKLGRITRFDMVPEIGVRQGRPTPKRVIVCRTLIATVSY